MKMVKYMKYVNQMGNVSVEDEKISQELIITET
jgi:hypothetical protein